MLGRTLVPVQLRLEGEDFVKEEVRIVDGQLVWIYAYDGSLFAPSVSASHSEILRMRVERPDLRVTDHSVHVIPWSSR